MPRSFRTSAVAALVGIAALAAAPALATPSPSPSPSPTDVASPAGSATIVYFNDAHEIGPVLTGGQDRGGVARLSTAIDGVRAQDPAAHVVFGGDLAGGTLFGGLYKGHPMVEAFNQIGVDLANPGQHDFDFGVENARDLIAASDFPWITSNLQTPDGEPFLPDRTWWVETVGDLTVGYIGLTDGMRTTSVGDAVIEIDHVEAATAAIADMEEAASPEVIVAVAQVPLATGEALVDALPQIDAVLLEEMAEYDSVVVEHGGAVLAAPEGNMGSLIRLDLERAGDGVVITPSVIEVDHTVTADPALREVELFYEAEMEENLSEVLAELGTPLLNPEHATRRIETRLGNLVADAFRAHHGAQIGWMNGGGIRAEATGPNFTLRDAYAIAPFDNKVMHVEVAGSGLLAALEVAVSRVEQLGGGFPQVSGMAFGYDPTAPVGQRVHTVTVGGAALQAEETYTVAVTNYVVGGGDGVIGFAGARVLVPASEALADAEVIAEHARALGTVEVELEGRITVGAAPELAPEPTTEPTPTATPTSGPTADPTPDPTPAPTTSDAPSGGPSSSDETAAGGTGGGLAATGTDGVVGMGLLAAALVVAGVVLARRRAALTD